MPVGTATIADPVDPKVLLSVLERVELNDAVANEDVALGQLVAHQIKGTALSFGAARLDELAKRLLDIDLDQRELLSSLVSEIDAEIRALQAVGT